MNHRYTRIIVTCVLVGSITLALKQTNQITVPATKLPNLKTSLDIDSATVTQKQTKKIPADKSMKASASFNITVNPNITSEHLKVHKFGVHSPKSILLTVNDAEIEVGNDAPMTIKVDGSNQIKTRCRWAFVMNHKGENAAVWQVEPGKQYNVSFSWDGDSKIQIDGAKLIDAKRLSPEEYKATEEKKNTHKRRRN